MNILFAASEMMPFCKTGGLADVLGALPPALADMGHNIVVMIPWYSEVKTEGYSFEKIKGSLTVSVGYDRKPLEISVARWKNLTVCLLGNEEYFGREGFYGDSKGGYPDNAARFIFYSEAVFTASRFIGFKPDIIHAHDWQAGLIMPFHKIFYKNDKWFSGASSLFTIHNIGYQGRFPGIQFSQTGLPLSEFAWQKLEYYGDVSFIKGGIIYSDAVSTVSGKYAEEITGEPLGFGLSSVLNQRKGNLFGILNGIDTEEWNPENDPDIKANYTPDDLAGKKVCRNALITECGFTPNDDEPVAGMVTRIDPQKGFDLLERTIDRLISLRLRIVILGNGTEDYCVKITKLAKRFPRHLKVFIKFDHNLAKRIYSGSDMFLMPSRYEPCGLGQLIAMRYGSLPIVHLTGGLADTVRDLDNLPDGNGFGFSKYSQETFVETVSRAVETFRLDGRKKWMEAMERAMREDFSWNKSARKYEELYIKLCKP